eukprot:scaffold83121_cov17-Tisochrysis_lutea.AAC.7
MQLDKAPAMQRCCNDKGAGALSLAMTLGKQAHACHAMVQRDMGHVHAAPYAHDQKRPLNCFPCEAVLEVRTSRRVPPVFEMR